MFTGLIPSLSSPLGKGVTSGDGMTYTMFKGAFPFLSGLCGQSAAIKCVNPHSRQYLAKAKIAWLASGGLGCFGEGHSLAQ